MDDNADAWQGCTHDSENPGNAWNSPRLWHCRRIKQVSGEALSLNYGTVYAALLKLEQEGPQRKANYYKRTRAERRRLEHETRDWQQDQPILAKLLSGEPST